MKIKGFTLIELLVVIAIIAILAAILFPVFAQAREKARQISCASNLNQMGLAILMYTQDFDEFYPTGVDNAPGGDGPQWDPANTAHWSQKVVPYIKAVGVYGCPDDPGGGAPSATQSWAGVELSYASNGLQGWYAANNYQGGCVGVMCDTQPYGSMSTVEAPVLSAKVGEPAGSIMLAESYNSDVAAAGVGTPPGSFSAFGNYGVISGMTWDADGLPIPGTCGKGGNWPATCTTSFPDTINGAVSTHHAGQTLANFLFCDGHVKAMHPIDTNPTNTESTNMWVALRP